MSPELHTPPLPVTHVWVGYHWQNNGLPPAYAVVTNTCTTSCRTPTLEFSRLRASKATFDAKVTPLAQPTSKNGRVAIRLQRFVGRQLRIETTATAIYSTYANQQLRMRNQLQLTEAWCRGCGQSQPHFASTLPAQLTSIQGRHDACFFVFLLASLRRVMRGAFADAFPAISGTHHAPVIAFGVPSWLLAPVVTGWMKAFVVGAFFASFIFILCLSQAMPVSHLPASLANSLDYARR